MQAHTLVVETYTYTYTHTYTYAHTHIHTYTYKHTYIYIYQTGCVWRIRDGLGVRAREVVTVLVVVV